MKKEIGVCLIGAGRAGMIHDRNFIANVPFARIRAVSDPFDGTREEAMKELGVSSGYSDYREALKDPGIDAVIIATPTKFHRDICVAAAEMGKDILCEKPMAMTVEECDDMISAC